MIVPSIGTPFLTRKISIKQNNFLNDFFQSDVIAFEENGPPASAIDFNKKTCLKAAIGEHLERCSVFLNNGRFEDEFIKALNLITLQEAKIPAQRVILNWGVPLLSNKNLENTYSDTCGMASHTNSLNAINSAFLEFFERQSLLYGWFTQRPGKKIELELLSSVPLFKRILTMCFKHVSEISIFDISLSEKVKVIITVATGNKTKGVGLSADWTYNGAILGSLKELFQYITTNSHEHNNVNIENNQNPLLYSEYFMKHVTPKSLKEDFSYLCNDSLTIDSPVVKEKNISSLIFLDNINSISKDLNIDLLLCFIPTIDPYFNTKIVKIITDNGFPHMFASKINPHDIGFLKNHKGDFYNIGKMLPFG